MNDSRQPTLAELQKWMRWMITDPRGVRSALAEPHPEGKSSRYQEPAFCALAWIDEQPPLSVAARLDIYAEAYFSRIVEVLEGIFIHTRAILGADEFARVIAEYLKSHPSATPDIAEVGRHLPTFCEGYFSSTQFSFIGDLSAAEWKATQSFLETPAAPLDITRLASFSQDDWARTHFHFNPALRLQSSKWDLTLLWKNQIPESERAQPSIYSIQEFRLEELSALEGQVLLQLQQGLSLGQILSSLGDETEPDQVMAAFSKWVQNGTISSFS